MLVMQMIGFVEELPMEWQQKWAKLASKRTLEISASKSTFDAILSLLDLGCD